MIEFCYKYLELMTLIKVINIKQNTLIKRKNSSFFQGSDKMAEELFSNANKMYMARVGIEFLQWY